MRYFQIQYNKIVNIMDKYKGATKYVGASWYITNLFHVMYKQRLIYVAIKGHNLYQLANYWSWWLVEAKISFQKLSKFVYYFFKSLSYLLRLLIQIF